MASLNTTFSQLRVGTCFELEGGTYVKVSPLIARHQGNGQQKLVRRATTVGVNAQAITPSNPPPEHEPGQLRAIIMELHQQFEQHLNEFAQRPSAQTRRSVRAQAAQSCNTALQRLGLLAPTK